LPSPFLSRAARVAGLVTLAVTAGLGASVAQAGDGSGSTNPQLRGSIIDPADPIDLTGGTAPAPVFQQAPLERVDINDPDFGYPVGEAPHAIGDMSYDPVEPQVPLFDLDWSLGLRGAYITSETSTRYEALVAPAVALTYEGVRGRLAFGADGAVSRSSDSDALRLNALRVSIAADYRFNQFTQLETDTNLVLTKASPDDPALASGVIDPPLTFIGTIDSTLTRQFGRFDVSLRGGLERDAYGPSTLTGPITQDNTSDNRILIGTGLRIAYGLTPIIKVFADGGVSHDFYDAPSPAFGVKANGTDYALQTGLSGNWGETLQAEGSIGIGLRRFDTAGVSEVVSTLFDAKLVYRPRNTVAITAGFATNVAPPGPDGTGTARTEYVASGDLAYTVNPWLALRALASWTYVDLAGSAGNERGYGFGVGADYALNRNTALTADYGFAHYETASNPDSNTHLVTVGVTVKR
jgi:hypothetical protein